MVLAEFISYSCRTMIVISCWLSAKDHLATRHHLVTCHVPFSTDPFKIWQFTSLRPVRKNVSRASILAIREISYVIRRFLRVTFHQFCNILLIRSKSQFPHVTRIYVRTCTLGNRNHGGCLKVYLP
jgi:hypothetical protein